MINASNLTQVVTFQVMNNNGAWADICTVHAYMAGLNNSEYWTQYAGGNAEENYTVSVRYRKKLMELIPQTSRIIHRGHVFDIISPPDDVLFKHHEIKFRIRRQIS